ncbi:MAG TPA: hypothetical protein PKY81_07465, partial [bacterium]|nr:hypothetical protein [bacterium]
FFQYGIRFVPLTSGCLNLITKGEAENRKNNHITVLVFLKDKKYKGRKENLYYCIFSLLSLFVNLILAVIHFKYILTLFKILIIFNTIYLTYRIYFTIKIQRRINNYFKSR